MFGESDRKHRDSNSDRNLLALIDVSSKEEECETAPYRSIGTDATITGIAESIMRQAGDDVCALDAAWAQALVLAPAGARFPVAIPRVEQNHR